jgi:hypothetical protein
MRAYEQALMRGDKQTAESVRRFYEERKYDMDDDYMRSMMGQALTSGTVIGQNSAANSGITGRDYQNALLGQAQAQAMQSATIAKQDFRPEFGVLYLHNKELPADWAGAKITEFQRRADQKWWQVQFSSKWDKALTITLYLDIEEYNGTQINEMARTYIEALNQRRVG